MIEVLARNWGAVLLRGVLAIAFALVAFFMPGAALFAVVIVFGAWAFVDGVFALGAAFGPNVQHRWILLLEGAVGLAVGSVTWFYPGITALTLLLVIAYWSILTGLMEVVLAYQLRKVIPNEWLLVLAGVASVAFGALLLARPGTGALAVLWIVASYALIFGVLMIGFSLRLRGMPTGGHASA